MAANGLIFGVRPGPVESDWYDFWSELKGDWSMERQPVVGDRAVMFDPLRFGKIVTDDSRTVWIDWDDDGMYGRTMPDRVMLVWSVAWNCWVFRTRPHRSYAEIIAADDLRIQRWKMTVRADIDAELERQIRERERTAPAIGDRVLTFYPVTRRGLIGDVNPERNWIRIDWGDQSPERPTLHALAEPHELLFSDEWAAPCWIYQAPAPLPERNLTMTEAITIDYEAKLDRLQAAGFGMHVEYGAVKNAMGVALTDRPGRYTATLVRIHGDRKGGETVIARGEHRQFSGAVAMMIDIADVVLRDEHLFYRWQPDGENVVPFTRPETATLSSVPTESATDV